MEFMGGVPNVTLAECSLRRLRVTNLLLKKVMSPTKILFFLMSGITDLWVVLLDR